ncbi:uncharacterized protein [Oscarella lobularis]|uniref:uncharacterized protein n=1 Tax=Oscarella lobularis TaxID=121494 RepID=UPI0033133D85
MMIPLLLVVLCSSFVFVRTSQGSTTTRNACYRKTTHGVFYRGSVAVTETGCRCQRWTSQSPNRHNKTAFRYPNAGLGDHNYCRNPQKSDDALFTRPWCFVSDSRSHCANKRWGYCDIAECRDTDCYSLIDRGASYRGNESRTVNLFGFERECENWKDSRTNYANGSRFSSYGLNDPSVLNKCRNPNPRRFFRPWCIPKFRIDGNAVAIPCTRVSPCRTAADVHSQANKTCVFPFEYDGFLFIECTTHGRDRPWCATNVTRDNDRLMTQWDYCSTESHLPDSSPFPSTTTTTTTTTTTASMATDDDVDDDDEGQRVTNEGAVAGGTVAAVVVAIALLLVVLVLVFRFRHKRKRDITSSPPEISYTTHRGGGVATAAKTNPIGDAYYETLEVKRQSDKNSSHHHHKADANYWVPARKEKELYSQIEAKQFCTIARHAVVLQEKLGSGQFGTVEKAVWKKSAAAATGEESVVVAVKTLKSTDPKDRVKFLQEAAIVGQFRHENIVELHGVVRGEQATFIVLELMERGDLKNHLSEMRIREEIPFQKDLLKMAREIACGMQYLCRKCFVHRDLAARNILLDGKLTCKIGDFGLSRDVLGGGYYHMKEGKKIPVRWTALEAIKFKKYSSASDVWSFGIVLFEIWSLGLKPYSLIGSNSMVVTYLKEGYRLAPPPGCPREIYSWMIDCWNPDHHKRPTFDAIVQRLTSYVAEEKIEDDEEIGRLGDPLDISVNVHVDLQKTYRS